MTEREKQFRARQAKLEYWDEVEGKYVDPCTRIEQSNWLAANARESAYQWALEQIGAEAPAPEQHTTSMSYPKERSE